MALTIVDGSLFTVEERLDTFKDSGWPFTSGTCTPLKLAEAGFYYCEADAVRCFVCHKELEGWEENDLPREEHKTYNSSCPFLKMNNPYSITVGDVVELEKQSLKIYIKMQCNDLRTQLTKHFEETIESTRNAHIDQENSA